MSHKPDTVHFLRQADAQLRHLRELLDQHGKSVTQLNKSCQRIITAIDCSDRPDRLDGRTTVEMSNGSWICLTHALLFTTSMLAADAAEQGRPA